VEALESKKRRQYIGYLSCGGFQKHFGDAISLEIYRVE
jgi:hypothetical protein